MALKPMKYKNIKIGARFSFRRAITESAGKNFALLTVDSNPLHLDGQFAGRSPFGQKLVHGMLAGALFSALVGKYCPGRSSLYLSQTLNFKRPIFYGDRLTVVGEVTSKNDSLEIITLKTEIFKNHEAVITGEAKVKVLTDD